MKQAFPACNRIRYRREATIIMPWITDVFPLFFISPSVLTTTVMFLISLSVGYLQGHNNTTCQFNNSGTNIAHVFINSLDTESV